MNCGLESTEHTKLRPSGPKWDVGRRPERVLEASEGAFGALDDFLKILYQFLLFQIPPKGVLGVNGTLKTMARKGFSGVVTAFLRHRITD